MYIMFLKKSLYVFQLSIVFERSKLTPRSFEKLNTLPFETVLPLWPFRVGNRSTISRELTDRRAAILGHRSTPSSDFSEPTLSGQKSVNACRGKFPTGLPEIRRKCNRKSIYQRLAVRFLLHFTLRCNRNQKK